MICPTCGKKNCFMFDNKLKCTGRGRLISSRRKSAVECREELRKVLNAKNKKLGSHKKYVCMGAKVVSKHDGEIHYISAKQLTRLYDVDPEACVILDRWTKTFSYLPKGLIILRPRFDGEYELNKQTEMT